MAVKVALLVLIVCCYVDCETIECTKAGYFADTSDETCKHYTLCVYDSTNAKYNNYYYTCSGTSIFNPNTQKCTDPSGYQCTNSVTTKPTTTTTTTTKPTTTELTTVTESTVKTTEIITTEAIANNQCTKEGSVPDSSDVTCKTYNMCIYNKDTNNYDAYSYTCQGTSVFNPNTAKCTAVTNYACGDTTTNEPTTIFTTPQENIFQCTKEGNFPDPSDNTCKQYEICVYDSASAEYKAYDFTCPGSSVFNPYTAKCTSSTNYICGSATITNSPESTTNPVITTTTPNTTTNPVITTTTPETTTNPVITTTTPDTTTTQAIIFECSKEGSFPDPSDITCTKYKVCIINNDTSKYDSYDYTCPGTTVFNPNTSQCTTTSNYKSCIVLKCSSFKCEEEGYFASESDVTCQQYVFCVYDSTQRTYLAYYMECPAAAVFNPITQQCTSSTNYNCKNVPEKETDTTTITTGLDLGVEFLFQCTMEGYFADNSDITCRQYIFCVYEFSKSKYVAYFILCPGTSIFNPETQECTSGNYVCENKVDKTESPPCETPDSRTTIEVATTENESISTFKCTMEGYFADNSDITCRQYIFCVYESSKSKYVAYFILCPGTSIFNPETQECTSGNYVCENKVDKTESPPCETPDSRTTIEVATTENESISTFKCTMEGYFADNSDITCRQYIFCVYESSKSKYVAYFILCPDTSIFNPETQECTSSGHYVCENKVEKTDAPPCETPDSAVTTEVATTETESIFDCKEKGCFAHSSDETRQKYIFCFYESLVLKYVPYLLRCPGTSIFNPKTQKCTSSGYCSCENDVGKTDPPACRCETTDSGGTTEIATTEEESVTIFKCTTEGYFADHSDIKCKQYIFCVYESSLSKFVAYFILCPGSSIFNPETQECTSSENYVCENKVDNTESPSCETTESETTTEVATTERESITTFKCTMEGYFVDHSDLTCRQYIFCVYESSMSKFVAYFILCPGTSIFNPETQECTSSGNYVCENKVDKTESPPCETSESETTTEVATTERESITFKCTMEGYFADHSDLTCRQYIFCVYESSMSKFVAYFILCPGTSIFNPETQECTSSGNYVCENKVDKTESPPCETNESETTTEVATTERESITFKCTMEGYFADHSDLTCRQYIFCVYEFSMSKFVAYFILCPGTSVFNPETQECTSSGNYVCENKVDKTESPPCETTDSETTTEVATTERESITTFKCTMEGYFADHLDLTCRQYIFCVYESSKTKYVAYFILCPGTSIFNPETQECTSSGNYVCENKVEKTESPPCETTDSETTTEVATTERESITTFKCTMEGYFADHSDLTCRQYIFCVYESSKTKYVAYFILCPGTSIFNPETQKCTSSGNYVCKNKVDKTESPPCETTDSGITTEVATTERESITFKCTMEGYFADHSDLTCRQYIFCVYESSKSKYVAYFILCPATSIFNPETQECTSSGNYVCENKVDKTDAPPCNCKTPDTGSTTEVTTTEKVSVSIFKCTVEGYFADYSDITCQQFIFCVYEYSESKFVAFTILCPGSSIFNPETQECTSLGHYVCENDVDETDPPLCETTDLEATTEVTTTEAESIFDCKKEGCFAHSSDETRQQYIFCVYEPSKSKYVPYLLRCPGSSIFNPDAQVCTSRDKNNCKNEILVTKTYGPPTITTNSGISAEISNTESEFKCVVEGYFADYSDVTCKKYILCFYDSTACTTLCYTLSCPGSSCFNSDERRCTASSNYECKVREKLH